MPTTESMAVRLDGLLGFPARALPFVAFLGFGFLLVTIPSVFVRLDESELGAKWIRSGVTLLRTLADGVADWQASEVGIDVAERSMQAVPVALVLLFLSAVLRAARNRAWAPLLLVGAGLAAGFLGVVLVAWFAQIVVWTVRLAGVVVQLAQALFGWAAPVVGVVATVLVLAAVGFAIFLALRWAFEERLVAVQAAGAALIVAVAAYFLRGSIVTISTWIGETWTDSVAPVIGFIIGFIIVLVAVVVAAMFIVLWCGGVGQAVFVPAARSRSAGHDPSECISMAVGVGLLLSLLVFAAASNAHFAFSLSEVWTDSGDVILPIKIYYHVLPDEVHNWVSPAFDAYSPIIDCIMLCVVTLVGSLSLIFTAKPWADDAARRVLLPSLLALAVGLVVIVPIVVMGAFLNSGD